MTEDGPSVCDVCGGPLRRVLFASGIIFKGSGFYRNDSRAGTSSSERGSEKPAAEKSDGTSTTTKTEKSDAAGVTKPVASD